MAYGPLSVQIRARTLALKRRLMLAATGRFDPFPRPPDGVALSPSRAHTAEYGSAPLRLSWRRAGIADPLAWQAKARDKLAELMGYRRAPGVAAVLHARDAEAPGGLRRRHLYLRHGAGRDVPVTLVWREPAEGPRPVMICLQGHSSGAHLSWGEVRMPADPIKIARGLDLALQAAERGYLAVCVEQACFGEREERDLPRRSADRCFDAANHALLLGRTLMGERVADVSAVIDWLTADGAGVAVDPARLHAMGNSTGGDVSLHTAALDTRIAGVIAGGCVGSWRQTIGRRRGCLDATIPGVLQWLEYEDVIALCAPRPVLAVSGVADHIYPFELTEAAVAGARAVYAALGAEDKLRAVPGPEGHRFYPAVAWPAFLDMVASEAHAPAGQRAFGGV